MCIENCNSVAALATGQVRAVEEPHDLLSAHTSDLGRASLRSAVERIERARREGIDIYADVYPYIASQTTLNMRLPDWTHEGGGAALAERLRDPELRPRIRREVEEHLANGIPGATPDTVLLARTPYENHRPFQGMMLEEVAHEMGVAPVD